MTSTCILSSVCFTFIVSISVWYGHRCQVEEVVYTKKDIDSFMTKLDGLVAANDPETIARYVNDVAAVTNSPSVQHELTKDERQAVIVHFGPSFRILLVSGWQHSY